MDVADALLCAVVSAQRKWHARARLRACWVRAGLSQVGIYSELCHLPANSSQQEVQDAITALCRSVGARHARTLGELLGGGWGLFKCFQEGTWLAQCFSLEGGACRPAPWPAARCPQTQTLRR